MLTRKHFEKMAAHIAELNRLSVEHTNKHAPILGHIWRNAATQCYEMAVAVNDNPNFNATRFRLACGFPPQ